MKWIGMTHFLTVVLLPAFLTMGTCKGIQREDTVLSSQASPDGVWRVTILERNFVVDGHFENSSKTYVLLTSDQGQPAWQQGQEFEPETVVVAPSRCGTLSSRWTLAGSGPDGEQARYQLHVVCDKCGFSLAAMGPHPDRMGPLTVMYDGFPELSSWEMPPPVPLTPDPPAAWLAPAVLAQRLGGSLRLTQQKRPAFAGARRKVP